MQPFVYRDYWISTGAYTGTPDDRMDRWYAWPYGDDLIDRRGAGYATKADAMTAVDEWHDEMADLNRLAKQEG